MIIPYWLEMICRQNGRRHVALDNTEVEITKRKIRRETRVGPRDFGSDTDLTYAKS
jgi:hypothetical protein